MDVGIFSNCETLVRLTYKVWPIKVLKSQSVYECLSSGISQTGMNNYIYNTLSQAKTPPTTTPAVFIVSGTVKFRLDFIH